MRKNQKKLKSENNFKIEGFFGNMMKDSKKKETTEISEDEKIPKKTKEEKVSKNKKEKAKP